MDYFTFLSKTIISFENNNNRMGWDDVVNMVMELSQKGNWKKWENNYYYLVRSKKLDGVKCDGRVVAEQPTTINRSSITVSWQWICCAKLEDKWSKHNSLNMEDWSGVVFDNVAKHFKVNFDESCFISNQYVSIKIVSSGSKKETDKNCDYLRACVTILRGGIYLEIKGLSFLYQRETWLGRKFC